MRDLSSAPVSRAIFATVCCGIKLQICRKMLNLERVGLICCFFIPGLWQGYTVEPTLFLPKPWDGCVSETQTEAEHGQQAARITGMTNGVIGAGINQAMILGDGDIHGEKAPQMKDRIPAQGRPQHKQAAAKCKNQLRLRQLILVSIMLHPQYFMFPK